MLSPTVVIVQKALPHYRHAFYRSLQYDLAGRGIALRLVYGESEGAPYREGLDEPWAVAIENRTWRLGRRTLYWQPCLPLVKDADLVIVEQASKLLVNYLLLAHQLAGRRRVALWGHGRNMQAHDASAAGERVKAFFSRRVHWWFAYNDWSRSIVEALGYPADRITSVQNAIDTRRLHTAYAEWPEAEVDALRQQIGLVGRNVGLFVGSMYPAKRLDFLVEACLRVRERVPDFEMIFVGSGSSSALVSEACATHEWMHYAGPRFGTERVPYFRLAKLLLMPGLVGLGVLDAFAMETPMVSSELPYHSPEFAYLRSGVNGLVVDEAHRDDAGGVTAYAEAVALLLGDEDRRRRLASGCRLARTTYSVEEMARRFGSGVEGALRAPPHWSLSMPSNHLARTVPASAAQPT